jgi:CheY-like chemotaxis protein
MSHELRTPLNSLLILAQLLADNADGRLSEQEVEFAGTIYQAGSDLLQLINDILDLSKVEAGRIDVRPQRIPLAKLLDYVRATFRPLTVDRGLGFEVTVGDDVPAELYSDQQRIQQVLRNLLSNAVKFTSRGGVELRVERVPSEQFTEDTLRDAETVLAFSVKDTGIGIPAEKLDVVFEAFQQSDGTTNRKYGGTGLGLSISREIAGLLGGRIDAESEEGVGSRFTLYVPARLPGKALAAASGSATPALEPAEPRRPGTRPAEADRGRPRDGRGEGPGGRREAPPAVGAPAAGAEGEAARTAARPPGPEAAGAEAVAPEAAGPEGHADREPADTWPETTRLRQWLSGRPGRVLTGRHVLIVDDDIRNVFALTHMLGRVGISVKYAENGREGFDVLDRSPEISLVLMDIMMPEVDGYEVIRTIRATPRLAGMPIIALTAKAMPGDRERAIEAGADGYVPKPVNVDRLLSAIYEQLEAHDRRAGGSPAAGDGPADSGTGGGEDRTAPGRAA